MIVAPDAGTAFRFASSSTPYFPAPRNTRCATNFDAAAMSRLSVSTPRDDIALLRQKRRHVFAEARRVHRPLRVLVEEAIGVADPRRPSPMHRDEGARGQPPVLLLPRQHIVHGDDGVGVLCGRGFDRDDGERRDEFICRQLVCGRRAVHEMRWPVHVCAGVFVEGDFVREEASFSIENFGLI